MHAHNPVNWYPWNEESLAKARKEDKPIFLSIGYSSCHWCHVMERESFLDEEIAKFLNEKFICIKVDREERPDVDQIYMQALMTLQRGRGGWPLSMFLMPDAKPFFGGTYWPARDGDRGATLGFLSIVKKVEEHYRVNRNLVEKDANVVTERTKESLAGIKPKLTTIDPLWNQEAAKDLASNFDTRFGGFRFSVSNPGIPKFPEPSNLFFLADQLRRAKNPDSPAATQNRKMLVKTCEGMMNGGIYDHLGGGFHRYSVDRYWRIPHFEKMLYDNGQLATVYSEAYELTGRDDFKRVVDGICSFVERELIAPSGGIYASLDADSEGEEGKFYRWEKEELKKDLTGEEYKLFADIYGINKPPNFEGEYYAPQLSKLMSDHASDRSISLADLESQLDPIRKKLFDIRAKRVRPPLDTKILTAWNGLMIRGLADAGRLLKNEHYIELAKNAASFGLKNLVDSRGRLFRTHTDGTAKLNGYIIDYACFINGLVGIHRATGEQKWLDEAVKLQKVQDELFWDAEIGGYFYTSNDHEVLIARSKRTGDGAMPSGNSVAAENLVYLAKTTGDNTYLYKAKRTVLASSEILRQAPQAAPRLLNTVSALTAKQ
jgi:uncharacterized protein YyaL (SSP411 family)